MAFNLQNSINFALTFTQYSPLAAGAGFEPAVSIGSMIKNSILAPGNVWYFNRNETTFPTVKGQQDYSQNIAANDFFFIEKATLTDDAGNIFEMKDVYNTSPLAVSAFQQRPNAIAAQTVAVVGTQQQVKFRFLGVPDQIYTVTVTYQKKPTQFGPFFITSSAGVSGGNTTYNGTFDPVSFPAGALAVITGFSNAGNNGTFAVVSSSYTQIVLANTGGVVETKQAFAINLTWDPIPDSFSDIYNNLFLSEAFSGVDDARAQMYRQRGVAAFMAKAAGLSETQRNIFAQQWLARGVERMAVAGREQLGNQGRGL